jgi:hypothetical protein
MSGLIYHGIQVRSQSVRIHSRRTPGCILDDGSGHKPPRR